MTTEPVGVPSLDSAVSIGFEQSVLGEGAMAPVATVIFTGQTQGSLTGTILATTPGHHSWPPHLATTPGHRTPGHHTLATTPGSWSGSGAR